MKLSTALLVALFLVFVTASARGSDESRKIPASDIRKKPPASGMMLAFAQSNLQKVSTSVTVSYDAAGNVTGLKLEKPTGRSSLDKAILKWATGVKINTTEPGVGFIPIEFKVD